MAFDGMSPSSPMSSGEKSSPQVTPDPTSKHADYINEGVKDPRPNDVLCGRGGSINSHPGNERFRQLVEKRKRVYLTARFKREKRLIASSIVSEIRGLDPPGRFLQQDKASGLWKDIGDEKARDKTSQALRENAPKIRADIETEINEQRAEMQKEEDDRKPPATQSHHQQHSSPSGPPPPSGHPGYYPPPPSGWGAYPPPPPYYGYGHPPHPHAHAAPPPPHPSYYPPPPPHAPHPSQGHWGYYPPPPTHSQHAPPPPPPQSAPSPVAPKSSVQQTAEYIASGAESVSESVKKWAETSFSFGGGGGQERGSDNQGDQQSVHSKPLSYVHQDGSKKRRMVKFSSDTKRNYKRYNRRNSLNSLQNSILSEDGPVEFELEPHAMDEDIENRSLMSSMASHILGSIGSWDTSSILCGVDNTDRDSVPFPGSRSAPTTNAHDGDLMEEDEMNVEWEGQEVQLMEKNDQDSVNSEDRMPPPPRQVHHHHENQSIAFSSIGSCHSWMPEQFNDAASSFFGSIRSGGVQEEAQMEQQMDYSTENFSVGGSIGGNSLTRVFEHDGMADGTGSAVGTPNMNQQALNRLPSWERSFRSRSPLSIGSDDADDISLISKESSKMSGANSREGGISVSPVNTPREASGYWGRKE